VEPPELPPTGRVWSIPGKDIFWLGDPGAAIVGGGAPGFLMAMYARPITATTRTAITTPTIGFTFCFIRNLLVFSGWYLLLAHVSYWPRGGPTFLSILACPRFRAIERRLAQSRLHCQFRSAGGVRFAKDT